MKAIRQSMRPKHQVLVLKCYPRYQKNAIDVKPNSSELSYLLYYASTRRSKIAKVVAFLEARTLKDIQRKRAWNVQITLQILKALVEKLPRDLPLYASYYLRTLQSIISSADMTMVEQTIPTFDAFCAHHEGASLAADQDYVNMFSYVVTMYAHYAGRGKVLANIAHNALVEVRWRRIGLLAMKALTASEAVGYGGGDLLEDIVVPVILQNLYSRHKNTLLILEQRILQSARPDGERAFKRRISNATADTAETSETNTVMAASSTADEDKMADEEVGLLALQSLKQVYSASGHSQVRIATSTALNFVFLQASGSEGARIQVAQQRYREEWAKTLFEMFARWTPVQDRYAIMVTALEILVRSPLLESKLHQQILLVTICGWLLRSSVNLIGLSVIDVLIGFIQRILMVLQLGINEHSALNASGHPQVVSRDSSTETLNNLGVLGIGSRTTFVKLVSSASSARIDLLDRLQSSIGDLATHIYYANQISDIIATLLSRMRNSSVGLASNINNGEGLIGPSGEPASRSADTEKFFSYTTARLTALRAIKEVLLTANRRDASDNASFTGRNKVSVRVWDGTHWLLSESGPRVRKAYIEAVLTWLKFETTGVDIRSANDDLRGAKAFDSRFSSATLARRAVSSATHPEKQIPLRSSFLQLLHLAIYDNALHYAHSESEILLLHLLLTTMVQKLGISAVRNGLPMIFRLQESINGLDNPLAKVQLGSLVHGYLWALSEKFDFETTPTGRLIHNEIVRRKKKGIWQLAIQLPPLNMTQIFSPDNARRPESVVTEGLGTEALRSFDDRTEMVDCIAESYAASFLSRPGSPPGSPSRVMSLPILSAQKGRPSRENHLPQYIRDQMLSDWNREIVLSTSEKETSQTLSLSGSKSVTAHSPGNKHLDANGANSTAEQSGTHTPPRPRSRPPTVSPFGLVGGAMSLAQRQRQEGTSTPASSSSRGSPVRVEELKKVLTGSAGPRPSQLARGDVPSRAASNDSLVSATVSSTSETGPEFAPEEPQHFDGARVTQDLSQGPVELGIARTTDERDFSCIDKGTSKVPSLGQGAADKNIDTETQEEFVEAKEQVDLSRPEHLLAEEAGEEQDDVPPVPPIPASLSLPLPGGYPSDGSRSPSIRNNSAAEGHIPQIWRHNSPQSHPHDQPPLLPLSPSVSSTQQSSSNLSPTQAQQQTDSNRRTSSVSKSTNTTRRTVKGRSTDFSSWTSFGSMGSNTSSPRLSKRIDVRELLDDVGGPSEDTPGDIRPHAAQNMTRVAHRPPY